MRQPLVAGNWKMNGLLGSIEEARRMASGLAEGGQRPACRVMICPPATLIAPLAEALRGTGIALGGQDCHADAFGAHTGDIAAAMLRDAGAAAVILGHSERRADHGERDRDVRAKVLAAYGAGLTAIVCVGETAGQRAAGLTLEVVGRQLAGSLPDGVSADNTVIAYEPVWAIGTGLTPTTHDVAEVHGFIRRTLAGRFGDATAMKLLVLYGGSVKPSNAAELMGVADVDGALVGGASLKATDFLGIIAAYRR